MPRTTQPHHSPPTWMRKGKMIGMIKGKWDPNIYFADTRKRKVRLERQWEDASAFEAAVRQKSEKAHARLSRSAEYIVQHRLRKYFEKHPSARTHYDDAYGHIMRYAIKKYISIVERRGLAAANAILSRKLLGDRNIRDIIQRIPKVEQPGYNLVSASTRKKTLPLSRAKNVAERMHFFPPEAIHHLRENLERTTIRDREKEIIRLHYGFDAPALQFNEIGERMGGLSRERIRQIHAKALSRLRQPENLKALGLVSPLDDRPRAATKKRETIPADMQRRGGAHPIFTNVPALLNPAPPPRRPVVRPLSPTPPAATMREPATATSPKKKKNTPREAKPKTARAPEALPSKRIAKPPKPKRIKKTPLQKAFSRMSSRSRRTIILFYLRENTLPQIADRLGIKEKEAAKALEEGTKRLSPEMMRDLHARSQARHRSL